MGAAARIALVAGLAAAGLLAVVGCGLALLFEVQGFGVPRDTPPRAGHVLGYGTGALAGVVVPAAVAWLLLPRGRRWVAGVAAALAALVVVAVLGATA
ncbi:hypothetical protein WDV85_05210 [Pseudokineococcus sp. 5B2Z-1]|uniref:hypothetical protein n=1 Tax=Pseudokineococcus sp. 5B2Z-1 TaxID=3132744 RepID=UPI0030A72F63